MRFSHTFIDRPILATVISVILVIVGGISYFSLPVSQYPEVVPPTIQVFASYPGASAETMAQSVATPLEQEINGVENMLYMFSQSTSDGTTRISITFELGTDLDEAQVLVQNRVAIAEPRLPEQVRRIGVTTRKNSPDMLLVVNLFSDNEAHDNLFIANYATLQMRDILARLPGVGDIRVFGAEEYAMRIWLDPDRMSSLNITAEDALRALRGQNIQVASGTLNQIPVSPQHAFELNVQTQGRLETSEEFEQVIVKSEMGGRVVRIRDIGRAELGAQSYTTFSYFGEKPAVAMPIFQRPGSNALETAERIRAAVAELSENFPTGMQYDIAFNPTQFVTQSINEVVRTIFEAVILVVLVIVLFLQSWRASLIPIVAIPVSLIGTFAVMAGLGFSLNNLTLFGLVLAIGIVVDDAIVVVENVERRLEEGLSPREAAKKTMDEVGGALIGMGLVLVAVFLPTAFLDGISGQFYRQFGITTAVATVISVFVSLTLSPAMAAVFLKARNPKKTQKPRIFWKDPIGSFSRGFNQGMNRFSARYAAVVSKLVRRGGIALLVYGGLMLLTFVQFNRVPTGFIPIQDQGYFIVAIQLPPGASLSRSDAVVNKAINVLQTIDGVYAVTGYAGFNGATYANASNSGTLFTPLESFAQRAAKGISYDDILTKTRAQLSKIKEAVIVVITPPPVRGIGTAGGFRMMVQDRQGLGLRVLQQSCAALVTAARQDPAVASVFSFFNTNTPQLYLDIDRVRAEQLQVPVTEIFSALEVYLGSTFVNDFNYLGRTFQVTAQAEAPYRLTRDDITRIKVRSTGGNMVPLGSVATFQDRAGPDRVPRYNLYPAAAVVGEPATGYSSGEALAAMERLAKEVLPPGISFEWTDIAYQQKQTGNTAIISFILAIVFVFLLLAGQYESWLLPLAIIIIVPLCLLPALIGVDLAGIDNNILTQIGLVVLVGLASKNAILIVEFAKQLEDQGLDTWKAATEAARLRLRPILMTSLAFLLGVVPLVLASGAGAEMRRALGTAVFSGMLGVTFFGLLLTPVFYTVCRRLGRIRKGKQQTTGIENTVS